MILQRIKVNCLQMMLQLMHGTENKGELLTDDDTINGVNGTENKGELLTDDDTINGVNGTENKGELHAGR